MTRMNKTFRIVLQKEKIINCLVIVFKIQQVTS